MTWCYVVTAFPGMRPEGVLGVSFRRKNAIPIALHYFYKENKDQNDSQYVQEVKDLESKRKLVEAYNRMGDFYGWMATASIERKKMR